MLAYLKQLYDLHLATTTCDVIYIIKFTLKQYCNNLY